MFSITPGLKHPGNKIDKDELVVYNLGHLSYAIADLMADDKSFSWVLHRDSQWVIFTVIPEVLALKGKVYCKGYITYIV